MTWFTVAISVLPLLFPRISIHETEAAETTGVVSQVATRGAGRGGGGTGESGGGGTIGNMRVIV